MTAGAYATLAGYSGPTMNATEVTVSDLNATESREFYRIKITYS